MSGGDHDSARERISAYLDGREDAFLEVDLWVRAHLRARYPALLDEEEDLCQIVHEKLLGNLRAGRFRGEASLKTYVGGITSFTAIDRLRERYRDRALQESLAPETATVSHDNPYRSVERSEEARLLHRVVHALPDACRELWRLVFVERLSYDAIGSTLSIPAGTVKSRMWHCRRKAAAILDRLTGGGGAPPPGSRRQNNG